MARAMDAFESRDHPSSPSRTLLRLLGHGTETAAGIDVTAENAMQLTAFWGAVRILAESIGMLPLHMYRRLDNGGKERARAHPLYYMLHTQPNPEMTAIELRETLQGHVAARGNGYAEIEWGSDGYPRYLWPLRPDKMTVKREDGDLWYYYKLPESVGGNGVRLPAENVLHIRGFSSNGIVGYSPVQQFKQSIGLGLAAERFGAHFFGNDARPGGVLEHPDQLSDPAHQRLTESWETRHQGLERSHRIAILEEGMKYTEIGLAPEDAQFLETRKFQVEEIARIFRMQPHLLADLENATFSNIEQQSLEFVKYTLLPWIIRWEQRLLISLVPPEERRDIFPEFLLDSLLRADIQTRYEAYNIAWQSGWMNADEIRQKENWNPQPDGQGQVYYVPLNMIPATQAAEGMRLDGAESDRGRQLAATMEEVSEAREQVRRLPAPDDETREARATRAAQSRHRLAATQQRVIRDAVARILRREANDVGNKAEQMLQRRDVGSFVLWLDEFYAEHEEFIKRQMRPVFRSYMEMVSADAAEEVGSDPDEVFTEIEDFVRSYLAYYAGRHVGSSAGQIRKIIREAQNAGDDPLPELEQRFEEWREKRPDKIALRETIRANNATAKQVYLVAGITRIRSVAVGDNCPYCNALNGRTISIQKYFLSAGDEFEPDGADGPLTVRSNKGHPPYHRGCDCMAVAG